MNTKSQDTHNFILDISQSQCQQISHVNTTASYCVHISDELLPVCCPQRLSARSRLCWAWFWEENAFAFEEKMAVQEYKDRVDCFLF